MLKRKAELFAPTDGVLYVMADGGGRSERGVDFSGARGLVEDYPLAFRRVRVSQRDVELAEADGSELTAKVECRLPPSISTGSDVLMDGSVFDLTRIERRGRTCWLWLSELACDGTCTLVSRDVTYDSSGIPHKRDGAACEVFCRRVAPRLSRAWAARSDELRPFLALRLRGCDYRGEGELLRDGAAYTVLSVSRVGRWVDLACERKAADR